MKKGRVIGFLVAVCCAVLLGMILGRQIVFDKHGLNMEESSTKESEDTNVIVGQDQNFTSDINTDILSRHSLPALERMEKNYQIPDYKADVCTAFAQGNVGKAIQLASSEDFNEIKNSALQVLKRVRDMELFELMDSVREISNYKLEINDYFDIMMIWYRDVLLYKATSDVNSLIFKDEVYDIKRQASKSSYEGIEVIIKALDKAKRRLNANVNFELVMELLLTTIKEN